MATREDMIRFARENAGKQIRYRRSMYGATWSGILGGYRECDGRIFAVHPDQSSGGSGIGLVWLVEVATAYWAEFESIVILGGPSPRRCKLNTPVSEGLARLWTIEHAIRWGTK